MLAFAGPFGDLGAGFGAILAGGLGYLLLGSVAFVGGFCLGKYMGSFS